MPARHAPARALKPLAARLSAVGVAAALVCGGVAAPLSVAAASAPTAPKMVKLHKHRALHNTVRPGKAQAAPKIGVAAVRLAATRVGDPYVYGAEGPRAFDCSGLVMWVYDHLGKHLPRTAGSQYYATRHIAHSELQPGDLIFFARGGTVYHVAIYAGHGWIWAAPYPGKDVEKEKLWTSNFMAGRVR